MPNKFKATDSRGTVHKRTSADRTYTHCVVVHFPAHGPDQYGRSWPAKTRAEWASRADLAEKNAQGWSRRYSDVEILTAERVS
jgi:hypothetical protein